MLRACSTLLLAALAWSGSGPAPEPEGAASPVVLMLPARADDRDERAEATILAQLEGSEIDLEIRRYDPKAFELGQVFARSDLLFEGSETRGVLWIDLGEDPALYVIVRGDPQLHGRRIDADEVGEAVAIESLASISATAALALAEGRAIELAPAEAPDLEAEPEADPPETKVETESPAPAPSITVDGVVVPQLVAHGRVRLGYRGQSYAAGLPWLSAAEIALGWRPTPQSHLEIAYEAAAPVSVTAPSIGLELQLFRVPLALAGGHRFVLRRGWGLELAGRLGIEPTQRRTVVIGEALSAEPPRWRVMAGAGVDLRATADLRDDLRLWLGLGLVGMFVRSNYVLVDMNQVLLGPSPVRISVGAGVEFDLIHR
ncbi:MAG: hypothetical protein KC431_23970 [Myxococcales bacterium]|nr:hypothetical protein [Myxococcales bacterium]